MQVDTALALLGNITSNVSYRLHTAEHAINNK